MKNMEEFIRTGMSTKAMLQEIIDDPEAGEKGFVADIVAHFYLNPKRFVCRAQCLTDATNTV